MGNAEMSFPHSKLKHHCAKHFMVFFLEEMELKVPIILQKFNGLPYVVEE